MEINGLSMAVKKVADYTRLISILLIGSVTIFYRV